MLIFLHPQALQEALNEMKKYIQLLTFGILLLLLSIGSIECLHVFSGYTRSLHGLLVLPLIYLVWVLQGTKEHRYLLRALNYRFRNHSKELVWKELYESLYGEETNLLYQWSNEHWEPMWNESTHPSLINQKACINIACTDMVKTYVKYKSDGFGRKLMRRWSDGSPNEIYLIASLCNLDL